MFNDRNMSLSCFSWCRSAEEMTDREIDLSHSTLIDVPSSIFLHERTLDTLYLNSNKLVDLPLPLFYCQNLQTLVLSDNRIRSLPDAISSLTQIQHLDLSRNRLENIPVSIKGCKKLTSLNLSMNPLDLFPEAVTQLISLEELYLNECGLDYIPANIGRLVNIRILELRDNRLRSLPKTLARFCCLTRLDIGQNDFKRVPLVVESLHNLGELWMDMNGMEELTDVFHGLRNLAHLDVSDNAIKKIPMGLFDCDRLTELCISNNDLEEVPSFIGRLNNLITLKLDYNYIVELPDSVGYLEHLEELYVSSNKLINLPFTIGLLRRLICLDADKNLLLDLHRGIGSCTNLRILSVQDNYLKTVPPEIGNLQNLSVLSLTKNKIRNMPISLLKMKKLKAVWLVANQNKPLTPFNKETDPETGAQVLTCYLLPQTRETQEPKNYTEKHKTTNKPTIRFSNQSEEERSSTFLRSPTPYPKKLKELEKSARAIASRTNNSDSYNFSENNCEISVSVNGANGGDMVRTAVVKKYISPPLDNSTSSVYDVITPELPTNGSLASGGITPPMRSGPPPYHVAAALSKKALMFHNDWTCHRDERRPDIEKDVFVKLRKDLLSVLPNHRSRMSLSVSEESENEGNTSLRRTTSDNDSAFVDNTDGKLDKVNDSQHRTTDGTYSAFPGIVINDYILPADNSYPINKVNNWLTTKTKNPVISESGCEFINMYPLENNNSQNNIQIFEDSPVKKMEDLITSSKIATPSSIQRLLGAHKNPKVIELMIYKPERRDLGFKLVRHGYGVFVMSVSPELAKQGLKEGDKVLQIEGVYIDDETNLTEVTEELSSYPRPFFMMISRQI